MTKILTQTKEIQTYLDDLIKKETERGVQLKRHLDELSQQLTSQNVHTGSNAEVQIGGEVKIRYGKTKFDKVFKAQGTYDELISQAQSYLGKDQIGFRDDQNRIVWIRADHDVRFMIKWCFAQELPFIQIVELPKQDFDELKKLNFKKECDSTKQGNAVFRAESIGSEGSLVFVVISGKLKKDEGFAYLQNIFGQFSNLMFVDDSEDIITVDSDESWEYCIETGMASSNVGKYPLLILDTHT